MHVVPRKHVFKIFLKKSGEYVSYFLIVYDYIDITITNARLQWVNKNI